MLDSKLHFHRYIDNLYSRALKLLGLIRFITYNLSSLNCLKVLYTALVRSNLEYSSVAWINVTLADSNKLENLQRKLANLCYNRFIQPNFSHTYESILNYLHLKTLYSRRQHLDALFLVNVFKYIINCFSMMDTVGLYIPAKQVRDFPTFRVKNVSRLSPSTRCVIAAISVCRSLDIFDKNSISLKDTLFMNSWSSWIVL
jgi:hypothetical protein